MRCVRRCDGMRALTFAVASDEGKVRQHNEDRWTADADAGLFVVSDGMGGAAHGELAAQIVVDVLPRYVEKHCASRDSKLSQADVLASAIAALSDELYHRSKAT